jgi:glycyl-tRNA synthetase
VDNETINDNTVTLRERDSMKQERVDVNNLHHIVKGKVDITELLKRF